MSRKRRVFSAAFKAKVALAAAKGDKTTAELASKFAIHSSQVTSWKKLLLEEAASLFEDKRRGNADRNVEEEELFAQIGKLQMELEWLKKKSAELD